MKITVLTATYNAARTIDACLDSVAAQKDVELEHIVIDGGSTDSTVERVAARDDPHLRWISEPDDGLYDALNKGLQRASGDLVMTLGADDTYADDRVIVDMAACLTESGAAAGYGDLVYVDKDQPDRVVRFWKGGAYKPGAFRRGWMPPHPTFVVRRDCWLQSGPFRLDLPIAADYELLLRLIHVEETKLVYLPRVMVRMRTGGTSHNGIANALRKHRQDARAWRINGLRPPLFVGTLKKARKLRQYVSRSTG